MRSFVGIGSAAALVAIALATPAQTANVVNERSPVVESGSPCTSEDIMIEAVAHIAVAETEPAAGGFHFVFHADESGRGATSQRTQYVANNAHQHATHITPGGAVVVNDVFHLNVIRQGESLADDDADLRGLFHVTETPPGKVIVVDRLAEVCK